MTVRVTEYTVGEDGVAKMPASLPPSTAYTYAVELSVDEANQAGASGVAFGGVAQPVVYYLKATSFLPFPVGSIVPAGRYDRTKRAWVPADNGRVIKVVSEVNGYARIDTDGNEATFENTQEGMTAAERQTLANLYAPGDILWRVPLDHFTPHDLNWPFPLSGSCTTASCRPEPPKEPEEPEECVNERAGSIIECENRVLGERLDLPGTGMTLNYRSDRTPTATAGQRVVVPLTGTSVHAGMSRARVTIDVAGQRLQKDLDCSTGECIPNATAEFVWDGRDRFGRRVVGGQRAIVTTTQFYPALYGRPGDTYDRAFARLSTLSPTQVQDAYSDMPLTQRTTLSLSTADATHYGLGGWTLDTVHEFDPVLGQVLYGDGSERLAEATARVRTVVPGASVLAVEAARDGSAFITQITSNGGHYNQQVSADGVITDVADCTPASCPACSHYSVGNGDELYCSDQLSIFKLVNRAWVRVAGVNQGGQATGDGGPAINAVLGVVQGFAVSDDGTMYLATQAGLRQVTPDGRIETIYVPSIGAVGALDLDADGSVVFVHRGATAGGHALVKRLRPNGRVETIAGSTSGQAPAPGGEGVSALSVQFVDIVDVVVDSGAIYVLSLGERPWGLGDPTESVRVVSRGRVSSIAGVRSNQSCTFTEGGPAGAACLSSTTSLAISPNGTLYVGQYHGRGLLAVETGLPGFSISETAIPTRNGKVIDVFDGRRHTASLDAATGVALRTIEYDDDGRVLWVEDRDGRRVTVSRPSPSEILVTGPDGHESVITVDGSGWAVGVANPEGEAYSMGYEPGREGLLAWIHHPANNLLNKTTFTYDALGRLIRDVGPSGETVVLSQTDEPNGKSVQHSDPLTLETKYRVAVESGSKVREVTDPSGLTTRTTLRPDGFVETTSPDGTVVRRWLAADPRLGMLAPYVRREETHIPGRPDLTKTLVRSRSVVGPQSPSSLWDYSSGVERLWVNPPSATPSIATPHYLRQYDRVPRTLATTSPSGITSERTFDGRGRLVTVDAPETTLSYARNSVTGRMESMSEGRTAPFRVTTLSHGSEGQLVSSVLPNGSATTYSWDDAARLKTFTREMTSDPTDDEVTAFTHRPGGLVSSVSPPQRPAHLLTHDRRGLLTVHEFPYVDDQTYVGVYFGLDAAGRLESMSGSSTNPLTFTYGPAPALGAAPTPSTGRLMSVRSGPSWRREYSHDAAGRVTLATGSFWDSGSPEQSVSTTYAGRLRMSDTFSGIAGGAGVAILRDYNNRHLLASETIAGQTVSFAYDIDGRLVQAGELEIVREPGSGRVRRIGNRATSGNGSLYDHSLCEWRSYDSEFGELSSIDYRLRWSAGCIGEFDGESILRFDYVRDDLGRIASVEQTGLYVDNEFVVYSYDDAGRLVDVIKNGTPAEHYEYDKNGNRTLAQYGGGAAVSASFDAQDRLTQYAGTAVTYDGPGRLSYRSSVDGDVSPWFDHFGNLAAVSVSDSPSWSSTTITYSTDALGRRVSRRLEYGPYTTPTILGTWLWRNLLQPAAQLDHNNSLIARYVYAGGSNVPDLVVRGNQRLRLLKDHIGSVRLVVDVATGYVSRDLRFDSFGRVTSESGDLDVVPFGFAGGIWDSASRLVRFGAREYDPETGRWTAKDPIRFAGGDTNMYAYVGNDPVNRRDPSGLLVEVCLATPQTEVLRGLGDHMFIRTGDKVFGAGGDECWDMSIDNHASWYEARYPDYSCTVYEDVDEDCVNQQYDPNRELGPWLPFVNDCRTFVHDVIKECSPSYWDDYPCDWP